MTTMKATMSTGLQLGMIVIPLKVYKAADDRQGIKLNQLHKVCGTRINEVKRCPEHGDITIDDVIKGYEQPNGYIQLTDEEIGSSESSKVLPIEQFVPRGAIGFAREVYYLGTDKLGAAAYALLAQQLNELELVGVTRGSMRGRERLMTVEPFGNNLTLVTHYWPEEIRDSAGLVPAVAPPAEAMVGMARQLITSMAREFDPAEWADQSTARLQSVIADKIAGRPIEKSAEVPAPVVPDLMTALTNSLAEQGKKKRGKSAAA